MLIIGIVEKILIAIHIIHLNLMKLFTTYTLLTGLEHITPCFSMFKRQDGQVKPKLLLIMNISIKINYSHL